MRKTLILLSKEMQEYKYIDGEFVINAKVRANNIKQELEELDKEIDNILEVVGE